jgi:hypothetical protein
METKTHPAEWAIDAGAAALLAGAVGFACAALGLAGPPALAAGGAFAMAMAALRWIEPAEAPLRLPAFDLGAALDAQADYPLDLTDRLGEDELLLDDVLPELEPDSRIVRLFDPAQMPTAGDLHDSIDRHVGSRVAAHQSGDAAQALSEALRDLRRSLG